MDSYTTHQAARLHYLYDPLCGWCYAVAPQSCRSFCGEKVDAHFAESRDLLAKIGGKGFPTFAIERDGRFERLDHTQVLGKPDAWRRALQAMNTHSSAVSAAEAGCGPGGCRV